MNVQGLLVLLASTAPVLISQCDQAAARALNAHDSGATRLITSLPNPLLITEWAVQAPSEALVSIRIERHVFLLALVARVAAIASV